MKKLIQRLEQHPFWRRFFGDSYAKIAGRWHACNVVEVLDDGKKMLKLHGDEISMFFHQDLVEAVERV